MKACHRSIAFVLTIYATLGVALQAGESTPSVDAILDKYVAASGSKAALEKVTSRVIKGSFEFPGMPAATNWQMYAKAPNKQLSEVEIPGMGTFLDGFDGAVAWTKSPFDGLRIKEGEELVKTKRDAEFYRQLKFKTLYPGLAYKRTEKVDGEEAYVLEANPSGASMERFYFSVKSGLLVRQESEFVGPQGKTSTDVRLGDYRVTDGVNIPRFLKFKTNAGGPEFEFVIKIIELRHNVTIEDAKFARPTS